MNYTAENICNIAALMSSVILTIIVILHDFLHINWHKFKTLWNATFQSCLPIFNIWHDRKQGNWGYQTLPDAQDTVCLHSQTPSCTARFTATGCQSVTGNTDRGAAEAPPLSIQYTASRWLTSIGRKPFHIPHMPYYVKTWLNHKAGSIDWVVFNVPLNTL